MNTSYFAKYKGDKGVSISLTSIPNFQGEYYSDLCPSWSILNQYKKHHNEELYIIRYHQEILNKLDPFKVYNDLYDKTLLCWEKSGDFCHRRIVAEWIEKHTDNIIPELGYNTYTFNDILKGK